MSAPESPYRRPAQLRRPALDFVGALCAFLCLAAIVGGVGLAFVGCDEAAHGGGDAAVALALVGEALLLAGTGCSVLLARGAR
jgi:hypothetical protein